MSLKVSVVTTVLDERDGMSQLLRSLAGQEDPYEVIVVDAGSTDGTADVVRDWAARDDRVRLVHQEGPRGEGFNRGIQEAKGDAVAFIGGDDWADPDWIAALRRGLEEHDAVHGHCVAEGDKRMRRVKRVPLVVQGVDISVPGTNTAFRREVLEEVGGIDTSFVTAEDIDLHYRVLRAGYRMVEVPDAVVHRLYRGTLRSSLRQAYWNGYGRGQLVGKHGSVMRKAVRRSGGLRAALGLHRAVRMAAGALGYVRGRRDA